MSTQAAQARLKEALRELELAWKRAGETWRDDAAAEFYKDVIEPLEPKVRQTVTAMGELGEALRTAQQESE